MAQTPRINPWRQGISIFSGAFRRLINVGLEEAAEAIDRVRNLERLFYEREADDAGGGVTALPYFFAEIDGIAGQVPQKPIFEITAPIIQPPPPLDPGPPPWKYEWQEVQLQTSSKTWIRDGRSSSGNDIARNLAEYNGVPNGVQEQFLPGNFSVQPIQASRIVVMWIVQYGSPPAIPPAFWFDSPNGIDGDCGSA